MALMTCKECGNQVSDEAKTCPKCGAKVPQPPGRLKVLLAGAVAITVGYGVFGDHNPPPGATSVNVAKSHEELEDDARMDTARASVKAIREAMRDPASLVIEAIGVDQAGSVACINYRAKNGFGGMNREAAVMAGNSIQKATRATWKKYCAGRLIDMKWAVE